MRRRAWAAWGALTLGIVLGVLGRILEQDAWNLLAGLCLLAAIVLALSLLPVARALIPGLQDFPDLFDEPRPTERWCATCGHPTQDGRPCLTCGAAAPQRRWRSLARRP